MKDLDNNENYFKLNIWFNNNVQFVQFKKNNKYFYELQCNFMPIRI